MEAEQVAAIYERIQLGEEYRRVLEQDIRHELQEHYLSYQLQPPFDVLLSTATRQLVDGGGESPRREELANDDELSQASGSRTTIFHVNCLSNSEMVGGAGLEPATKGL